MLSLRPTTWSLTNTVATVSMLSKCRYTEGAANTCALTSKEREKTQSWPLRYCRSSSLVPQ